MELGSSNNPASSLGSSSASEEERDGYRKQFSSEAEAEAVAARSQTKFQQTTNSVDSPLAPPQSSWTTKH